MITPSKNGRKQAIVRLIVLLILLFNSVLTAIGKNPIPWDESQITEAVNYLVTGIWSIWVWWKNNNITVEAQVAQTKLEWLKQTNKCGGENLDGRMSTQELNDPPDAEE